MATVDLWVLISFQASPTVVERFATKADREVLLNKFPFSGGLKCFEATIVVVK